MKRFYVHLSLVMLLVIGYVATVSANLVYVGPIEVGGTGLGAVNTVLTIQGTPSQTGCVAWNGSSDVVGPAACPPAITGGDEKTGASQTLTRSIMELGLANAASIRVVMNANEPAHLGITVNQLVLRIYDASSGLVLFSGSLAAPVRFPDSFSGTGNAGFAFALDASQAAAAQTAFGNTANRLGLSTTQTNTLGGPSTLFIVNVLTAQLGLVKTVSGGTALPTAFTLTATGDPSTGPTVVTGTTPVAPANVPVGVYTLTESGPAGYTSTGFSCAGGGTLVGNRVTITAADAGRTITCTIANTFSVAAVPTLSEWGMIILAGLLALFGFAAMRT